MKNLALRATRHAVKTPRLSVDTLVDQITKDALRRAALAPTYMAALDITGAALLAVAAVVRMEGRCIAA
ncbi:hypothetical protein [Paraburkholderia hospita]|uniref:hypothetical protein n=1 Tax=Paraburkholderia hospita TaxID=169430 RepID=UPI000B343251|nr:hypothetical protein [Paraburkholderia hospita]OUL68700.1 hypothetical protein CA603_51585 [Paraburkholderia hospita]